MVTFFILHFLYYNTKKAEFNLMLNSAFFVLFAAFYLMVNSILYIQHFSIFNNCLMEIVNAVYDKRLCVMNVLSFQTPYLSIRACARLSPSCFAFCR